MFRLGKHAQSIAQAVTVMLIYLFVLMSTAFYQSGYLDICYLFDAVAVNVVTQTFCVQNATIYWWVIKTNHSFVACSCLVFFYFFIFFMFLIHFQTLLVIYPVLYHCCIQLQVPNGAVYHGSI